VTRFVLARLADYSDEALRRELRRVARLVPDRILTRKAFDAHARVRAQTVADRFGGWRAALAAAGLGARYSGAVITEKRRRRISRHMTDDELLAELRDLAAALGQATVTRKDVDLHGRVGSYVYFTRFGAWGEALRRAGLAQTRGTRRFADDDLAANMRAVWTHLGRQPHAADMARAPSRISARTYQQRFGSWRGALVAFVAFAAGKRKRYVPRAASVEVTPPHATRCYARRRKTPVGAVDDAGAGGRPGRVAGGRRGRLVPLGLRYAILERDRFRCLACGRSPATHAGLALHVDHVVPWSKGGATSAENLRTLCAECNIGRGAGRWES
jgi:hypothetical protein